MSKFFTIVAAALVIISGLISLPAQAQTAPSYLVATAKSGLFVRDQNCNKVGSTGYASILTLTSSKTITCKINGVNTTMVNAYPVFGSLSIDETSAYVSKAYTTTLIAQPGNSNFALKSSFKVNAVGGLNLRDQNCKRVTTVPNGTILQSPTGVGGSVQMCQVKGKFYEMSYVNYKGNLYQVASVYIS